MKKRLFSALTAFVIICISLTPASAAEYGKVTPALDIIANDLLMVKTGLTSDILYFEPEDFDSALGLKKVQSVTITALPSVTDGKLMLGSLAVAKNQTISRASLSSLRFESVSGGEASASFSFTTEGLGYSVKCNLYLLEKENAAPTVSLAGSPSFSTYKNISYFGTLRADDPENDELTFTIVSAPKKGSLRITDTAYGSFIYSPDTGFTGCDSFTYCVYDRFGSRSEDMTVSITIEKCDASMTFSDMVGHYAHPAAIRLASAGVMTGSYATSASADEAESKAQIFSPDEAVSRAEFVFYTMKALGIAPAASVIDTGFIDDSDIPAEYKGYIAAAAERGYISGVVSEAGAKLYPNYVITRAEVAVILNNILDCKEPAVKPVFSDFDSIPSWAEPALSALTDCGIFSGTGGGNISPYTIMNRAMTAETLCAVMDYLED